METWLDLNPSLGQVLNQPNDWESNPQGGLTDEEMQIPSEWGPSDWWTSTPEQPQQSQQSQQLPWIPPTYGADLETDYTKQLNAYNTLWDALMQQWYDPEARQQAEGAREPQLRSSYEKLAEAYRQALTYQQQHMEGMLRDTYGEYLQSMYGAGYTQENIPISYEQWAQQMTPSFQRFQRPLEALPEYRRLELPFKSYQSGMTDIPAGEYAQPASPTWQPPWQRRAKREEEW